MGDRSAIEWTDATWTPIRARHGDAVGWHCEHVSEGCRNCYAEAMNRRLGTGLEFKPGHRKAIEMFLDEEMLLAPLRWQRPRMIFVCSMTDLFAGFVPDAWIDQIFAVAALCPQHILQVLTKRTERMRDYLTTPGRHTAILAAAAEITGETVTVGAGHDWPWPLPNVWAGSSVEDQATAEERIPILLDTPAAVRWLSMEPLLGQVDLTGVVLPPSWVYQPLLGVRFDPMMPPTYGGEEEATPKLDWIVLGGESGRGARPMHPDWVRSVRDQCSTADVPFLFKQWGQYAYEQLVDTSYDHIECVAADGRRFAYAADLVSGTAMPRAVLWDGAASWEAVDAPPPGAMILRNVGKKAAGRHIDGREHDDYPREETME